MWIGHFKVWHENCIYLTNCSKFNVVISMYPLKSNTEEGYYYHTNLNILSGEEENIRKFIKEIKKDSRCLKFEGRGNIYFSHLKTGINDHHTTNYYTPKIFLLKPIVHKDGREDWFFGAWERKTIIEMLKTFRKHFNVEVLSVKEREFTDVFIPQVMPKITERQKEAIYQAIINGYYDFPRKITLEKLSKSMNVSRVTFLEHLRKAEGKLIPNIFGYSIKDEKA
jgi:predicted DNA binding protein